MKMLNNVLEVDAFATSRIPIQSPPSMKMEEGDPQCGARPPEPLTQVHHDHHAEDGAVVVAVAEPVAEPVAVAEARERYKNSVFPPTVPVPCVAIVKARWDANANVPRPDVDPPPNDHGVVKWGVSGPAYLSGFSKPAMASPKPSGSINKSEPRKSPTNAGVIICQANGNPMGVNRLIAVSCEKIV